jgi:pentatricopeptide repeat protein
MCKAGKLEEAKTKLDEILKNGLVPDVLTYNSMIDGLCKKGM